MKIAINGFVVLVMGACAGAGLARGFYWTGGIIFLAGLLKVADLKKGDLDEDI